MKQLTVSVCSQLWSQTLGYAITSNRIGSSELKENAFMGPCSCKVLYFYQRWLYKNGYLKLHYCFQPIKFIAVGRIFHHEREALNTSTSYYHLTFFIYFPDLILSSFGFSASSGISQYAPTLYAPGILPSEQRTLILRCLIPHFSDIFVIDK